jgi:uncharacterized membrane protein
VEGLVLVWTGVRAASRALRATGVFLFACVALRLLIADLPADRLLLNVRFATWLTVVACMGLSLLCIRSLAGGMPDDEKSLFAAVAVGANVLLLVVLSQETWDAVGRSFVGAERDQSLARHMALSILWTVFASGLMLVGVLRRAPLLRWQAIALFGLVTAKTFLHDISFLQRAYRILSFVVIGVALVTVSFLYQRRLRAARAGTQAR